LKADGLIGALLVPGSTQLTARRVPWEVPTASADPFAASLEPRGGDRPSATEEHTMTELDRSIRQVLDDYKAAVWAKDVEAFVALYDAEVRVFDMWGVWSQVGLAAWRAMAVGWFGSLGTERVAVEFSEVQASVSAELAIVHAFVRYAAIGADDEPLRALDNRMTLALRRDAGGAWKVVHEHTSAPLDHSTTQAVLQR
jgi:ketosteroid isomerase-like protein